MKDYNPFENDHDHIADKYDQIVRKHLQHYIRENYFLILDRVASIVSTRPGQISVLDIGIGTGLLTQRLPVSAIKYGVDVSEKMLEQLKKKKLCVQTSVGHFLQLPYEDDLFDFVVSTFALHHVPSGLQLAAFDEIVRVLKPNGVVVIADFMTRNPTQRKQLIDRFSEEKRHDMLLEMEEEHFVNIEAVDSHLSERGLVVKYERLSTLSWILQVTMSDP